MRTLFSFLPRLWANWITLLGSVITTLSGIAILLLVTVEFVSSDGNPYAGTLLVVVLPALFLLGLLFIPVGLWFDRRRRRKAAAAGVSDEEADPIIASFRQAMKNASARRRVWFVALATIVNVVLFSVAGHQAVTYMDSPKFCGTACHTAMEPEWNAYNASPHSRVACVQCHIGPGASSEIKAKINGVSQLWGVIAGNHSRPVPAPVRHMRPAKDTCEQCHAADKYIGNRLQLYPHYKTDKDNTPVWNAMLLHVGGKNAKTGQYEGIHRHANPDVQVRYEYLDAKRTKVGKITVVEKGKVVAEYLPPKPTGPAAGKPAPAPLGERTMDCIDCHNRPTHVFDQGVKVAVDRAMYAGLLDPKVPYLTEMAVAVLAKNDVKRDEADAYFRKALEAAYAKSHADARPAADVLDKSAKTIADLYRRNVYPEMKVAFGTYKSHAGHSAEGDEVVGCYRCHDKEHEKKLADGTTKTLSQDCELCHETLAAEEDPAKFDESLQALLPKDR